MKNGIENSSSNVASVKFENKKIDGKFLSIIIEGEKNGKVKLHISLQNGKSKAVKMEHGQRIEKPKVIGSIWLAVNSPNMLSLKSIPNGSSFDIKSIVLSR